jgi:hypothetical protein
MGHTQETKQKISVGVRRAYRAKLSTVNPVEVALHDMRDSFKKGSGRDASFTDRGGVSSLVRCKEALNTPGESVTVASVTDTTSIR